MDFTPGERAVLAQIRVLYKAAGREQQVKALIMQWPPTHFETYRKAYAGLVAKHLIRDTNAQAFTITDAGLRAIGVAAPATPPPQPPRMEERRPVQRAHPQVSSKTRGSVLSRLVKGLLWARG